MKKVLILTALSLMVSFSFALGIDAAQVVKNHPVQADYPQDESVILYEGINYSVDKDGKISKTVHIVRTMFTENALDEFGDPALGYYEDYQNLDISICRGYMLSGKTVDTQKNGLNQRTPLEIWSYPDYTGFQEIVCTHTGLEWGGSSELKYTLSDKVSFQNAMEGIEYFQGGEPIRLKEVSVTTPENINLNFKFMNGEGNMKQTVKDGITTRTWTMKDVPAIAHDDAFKYRMRFVPTLIFTTCPDWKQAAVHMAEHISKDAAMTDYLKTELGDAVKNCQSDDMRIEKTAEFVRDRVTAVRYDKGFFDYYAVTADDALSAGYANKYGHAVLLTALLRGQGYKANIIVSGEVFEPNLSVPAITQFDKFWVCVEQGKNEKIVFDPAHSLAEASKKDLAGNAVFVFDYSGEAPTIVPEYPMEKNITNLDISMRVNEDGTYGGRISLQGSGIFSPYYKAVYGGSGADEYVRGIFEKMLLKIKVDKIEIKQLSQDNCVFSAEFKGEKPKEAVDGYLTVKIPQNPIDFKSLEPSGLHLNYVQRSNPIYFKGKGKSMVNIDIEMPEGWKIISNPPELLKESSIIGVRMTSKIEGQKYSVKIVKEQKEQVVKADSYPVLHLLYQSLNQKNNEYLVIKMN